MRENNLPPPTNAVGGVNELAQVKDPPDTKSLPLPLCIPFVICKTPGLPHKFVRI